MTTEPMSSDPTLHASTLDPDAPADPRWHLLAAGALSPDEASALHDEAQATDEGRLLWELYHPLDEAEKARFADGVKLLTDGAAPAPGWWARLAAWWEGLPRAAHWAPAVAACAVAAVVLLHGSEPTVEVAWSHSRGRDDRPLVLATPDAAFTATIVPQGGTTGPLVVRGGLLRREGRARAWTVRADQAPDDGTIVIAGPKKALFPCVPAGEWEVLVAVGRPGPAPSEADMIRLAEKPAAGSLQILKKRVVLEGPGIGAGGEPCREDDR